MALSVDNLVDNLENVCVTLPSCVENKFDFETPFGLNSATRTYLAHTVFGVSLRELARSSGVHPSTILRQVRKIESRRDDPLVDRALDRLAGANRNAALHNKGHIMPNPNKLQNPETETPSFDFETCRILKRLNETGSVLAVAQGLDNAVIVRETQSGVTQRLATVPQEQVMYLALQAWISPDCPEKRIVRYQITAAGKTHLDQAITAGFNAEVLENPEEVAPQANDQIRMVAETPLMMLARRKVTDGEPFLTAELVAVGERLREDFEIACLEGVVPANWEGFTVLDPVSTASGAARNRVSLALEELGPGLADVAYKTCCQLQGLEKTERAMGWAARSSKIVLRIALQRLVRHYLDTYGTDNLVG